MSVRTDEARIWLNDIGLLLIRGIAGIVFIYHGSQKLFGWFEGPGLKALVPMFDNMGFPMPTASAVLAGSAEFFGGLCLLLGLATRIAAIPVVFTMLVASFVVHGKAFGLQHSGMEYALTLACVVAGIGFTGAGRLSLDWVLRGRRKRRRIVEPGGPS
ncbi:MAG: hypothetical protein AMXMBFR13_24240 [Phycisphaerae bacterium]